MADYNVVNPPQGASFTPPRFDPAWLGDLPQSYYQGAAARREKAIAEAFPEGLPKDANGRVDYNELTNRVMKLGGPAAAGPMINTMMGYQIGEQAGNVVRGTLGLGQPDEGGYQQPATGGPRAGPTGPAHLGVPSKSVAPQGYDSQGDNVRSLVTEHLPGVENPKLIQYIAGKLFPGDENGDTRTLSADQSQQVVKTLVAYKSRSASTAGPPGPSPAGMGAGVGDPAQPQTGGQPAAQPGPMAAASGVASTGQPGPGPAPAGPMVAQVGAPQGTPQSPPAAAPRTSFGGEAGVPPEYTWARRQQLDQQAKALRSYATSIANVPQAAKAAENAGKAAEYLEKQVHDIDEYRSKAQLPTEAMKDAAASGSSSPLEHQGRKDIQEADIKHAASLFNGINSMADLSAPMIENLRQQKAMVNHPEFTSGNFNEAELWLKRQMPSIFGHPTSMELYRKTLAESISREMNGLASAAEAMGEKAGRIFLPQIQQIQTMSGGLDNSVGGLRALAEIRMRTHERNLQVADFAANYKTGNLKALPPEFRTYGRPQMPNMLDTKFEQGLRKWMGNHPLFTDKELADPRVMGAREPPPLRTPQEIKAWSARVGLKPGEPVRINGKIQYAP
jgi:hypothetical protein